ncbi:hypothetical protein P7K49_004421 [Saguinus oedipus]|uniref:Uncharacterized protein n=1 Tax=Saguinus oedipus TaxID=9490 RepID=A0ABQ9W7R6_SAGOE|nr:hypothetical protein P7K49_004421 [Saguinus oedipus]
MGERVSVTLPHAAGAKTLECIVLLETPRYLVGKLEGELGSLCFAQCETEDNFVFSLRPELRAAPLGSASQNLVNITSRSISGKALEGHSCAVTTTPSPVRETLLRLIAKEGILVKTPPLERDPRCLITSSSGL